MIVCRPPQWPICRGTSIVNYNSRAVRFAYFQSIRVAHHDHRTFIKLAKIFPLLVLTGVFLIGPFPAYLFPIQLTEHNVLNTNSPPMTGFEQQTSGSISDRSANSCPKKCILPPAPSPIYSQKIKTQTMNFRHLHN